MVCFIGSYQFTDQPSVQYVLNHTDVPTHGTVGHTDKPVCTVNTDPLLDWYIPPISGDMLWYGKPWLKLILDRHLQFPFHGTLKAHEKKRNYSSFQ